MRLWIGFTALLLPNLLAGQAHVEDALLRQLNGPLSESIENATLIQQEGLYNRASVQQWEAQGNQVLVTQLGEAQVVKTGVGGSRNAMDIRQHGDRQQYTVLLQGEANRLRVDQYGAGNSIYQDLQVQNMEYAVTQHGQGLELILIEQGLEGSGYKVWQQGHDMKVIIERGVP